MRPVVAITLGDYNGIGPEIILKSLRNTTIRKICTPLLVGPEDAFAFYADRLGEKKRWRSFTEDASRRSSAGSSPVYLAVPNGVRASRLKPGTVSSLAGRTAVTAIKHAFDLLSRGVAETGASPTRRVLEQARALHGAFDFDDDFLLLEASFA